MCLAPGRTRRCALPGAVSVRAVIKKVWQFVQGLDGRSPSLSGVISTAIKQDCVDAHGGCAEDVLTVAIAYVYRLSGLDLCQIEGAAEESRAWFGKAFGLGGEHELEVLAEAVIAAELVEAGLPVGDDAESIAGRPQPIEDGWHLGIERK